MENTPQGAPYTYQATQISTATKEQLLLITYDIGIRSCRMAEAALDRTDNKIPDIGLAHQEILRAQEVVRELMVTLNTQKGGDMAHGLMRLYDYMYRLLVEANVKKEPDNVHIVLSMLEELKATWEEALLKLLKEYQTTHPEDEDFKGLKDLSLKDLDLNAIKVSAPVAEAQSPYAAKPAPVPPAAQQKPQTLTAQKASSGGLNIAG
ncbi:MAG: flagellar export chaperone FliS [Synergistaceae bacterium]|jgi:flagellar protein FliS|nr:flagellar export chaperone FliS [Synergistaceae bacterium]